MPEVAISPSAPTECQKVNRFGHITNIIWIGTLENPFQFQMSQMAQVSCLSQQSVLEKYPHKTTELGLYEFGWNLVAMTQISEQQQLYNGYLIIYLDL